MDFEMLKNVFNLSPPTHEKKKTKIILDTDTKWCESCSLDECVALNVRRRFSRRINFCRTITNNSISEKRRGNISEYCVVCKRIWTESKKWTPTRGKNRRPEIADET